MSLEDFFYSKKYWVLRHAVFWLFIFLDELLSLVGLTEEIEYGIYELLLLLDVVLVYFNIYYLIPKFFNQGKIKRYIGWTFFTLILNTLITNLMPIEPMTYVELFTLFIVGLIYTTGLLSIAIAIKISKTNLLKMREFNALQKVNYEVETSNLKKQINPHFMFNVLNNIYVQSREDPKSTPDSILKLSDLMRYQTYEAGKDIVSLNKEIEFIRQYIDFELMRRSNLVVNIKVSNNLSLISIPPMLFLPMIENACKHSAQVQDQKEWINMEWDFKDDVLFFNIENSVGVRTGLINDSEYQGFGLDNLKKRLSILYPDRHGFLITEKGDTFKAKLSLNI